MKTFSFSANVWKNGIEGDPSCEGAGQSFADDAAGRAALHSTIDDFLTAALPVPTGEECQQRITIQIVYS